MKNPLYYTLILLTFTGFTSCKKNYVANGEIAGKKVNFIVDSPLAARMIENDSDPELDKLFKKYDTLKLNTKTLASVANEYSLDVSALYFLRRIYQDSVNNHIFNQFNQIVYHSNIERKRDGIRKMQQYHFVFIPGFFYKSFPFSGADFRKQRELFDKHHISYDFIETGEKESVEKNAAKVYNRLKSLDTLHKKIILVSASKGGLETANVIGLHHDLPNVKAWISVCGILRGCPILDIFNTFPNNIIAPILFKINKIDPEPYKDFDSGDRKKDYKNLKFPEHILIIHYLGVPMASNVNEQIKFRYKLMKKYGANDGSCPLTEQLTEKGLVVADPGLDHYLKDDRIIDKTIALFEIAVDQVNERDAQ